MALKHCVISCNKNNKSTYHGFLLDHGKDNLPTLLHLGTKKKSLFFLFYYHYIITYYTLTKTVFPD